MSEGWMLQSQAQGPDFGFFSFFSFLIFIWLHQILVAALGIFNCGMWDIVS